MKKIFLSMILTSIIVLSIGNISYASPPDESDYPDVTNPKIS